MRSFKFIRSIFGLKTSPLKAKKLIFDWETVMSTLFNLIDLFDTHVECTSELKQALIESLNEFKELEDKHGKTQTSTTMICQAKFIINLITAAEELRDTN